MYKNVIFDMGNVLVMFYPEKTLKKYLDDEDEINLIIDKFYKSGAYRDSDRGVRTYDEILESIKSELPEKLYKLLRHLYLDQCFGSVEMPVFEEMYTLIEELKSKGYKCYLLSNAGFDFYEYSKGIPAIGLMDGKIISCEYKVLKPEPEIYNILFDTYKLNPSECVFIDDMQENIDGAKNCGMDGICFSPSFESVDVLRDKLKAKGID